LLYKQDKAKVVTKLELKGHRLVRATRNHFIQKKHHKLVVGEHHEDFWDQREHYEALSQRKERPTLLCPPAEFSTTAETKRGLH